MLDNKQTKEKEKEKDNTTNKQTVRGELDK
jgi:hypothetical protein